MLMIRRYWHGRAQDLKLLRGWRHLPFKGGIGRSGTHPPTRACPTVVSRSAHSAAEGHLLPYPPDSVPRILVRLPSRYYGRAGVITVLGSPPRGLT